MNDERKSESAAERIFNVMREVQLGISISEALEICGRVIYNQVLRPNYYQECIYLAQYNGILDALSILKLVEESRLESLLRMACESDYKASILHRAADRILASENGSCSYVDLATAYKQMQDLEDRPFELDDVNRFIDALARYATQKQSLVCDRDTTRSA